MSAARSTRHRPEGQTAGSPERPARRLTGAILNFDLTRELASLKQEVSWQQGDRNARTLVEEAGLRILLTVARAGTRVREHQVDGWVSVQTVQGHVQIVADGETSDLPMGHLIALQPEVSHDVQAIEESAFLVTIAWRAGEGSGAEATTPRAQRRSSVSSDRQASHSGGEIAGARRAREYRVLRMTPLIGDDRLDPRTQPGAGAEGSAAGPDMEAGREFEGQVVTAEQLAGMGRLRWEGDRVARLDMASESYRVEVEPLPPSGP